MLLSTLYLPGHLGRLGQGRSAAWSARVAVPRGVIPQAGPPVPPQRLGQAWLQGPQRWGGARTRDPAPAPPTCAHRSRGLASKGGRFLPPDLTGSAHRGARPGRVPLPAARGTAAAQREREEKEGEGRARS